MQRLIRGDQLVELVNTAMTLQGYTVNVTNVLQVRNMLKEFRWKSNAT